MARVDFLWLAQAHSPPKMIAMILWADNLIYVNIDGESQRGQVPKPCKATSLRSSWSLTNRANLPLDLNNHDCSFAVAYGADAEVPA